MLQWWGSNADWASPREPLGHCKGLRCDTTAPTYIGNDDKERDAVLCPSKSLGLTQAGAHLLTFVRARAGIAILIPQLRQMKAWRVVSDLC